MAVVKEVQHSAVEEGPSNELDKAVVAYRLVISTTIIVVDEAEEDVALVGKTMTSRNETVILQSMSVLTGR